MLHSCACKNAGVKGAEKNIVDGEKGNESQLTLYIKTPSTGVEEKKSL